MMKEEILAELYQRRAWEKRRVAELEKELRDLRVWEARTSSHIESVSKR